MIHLVHSTKTESSIIGPSIGPTGCQTWRHWRNERDYYNCLDKPAIACHSENLGGCSTRLAIPALLVWLLCLYVTDKLTQTIVQWCNMPQKISNSILPFVVCVPWRDQRDYLHCQHNPVPFRLAMPAVMVCLPWSAIQALLFYGLCALAGVTGMTKEITTGFCR